MASILSPSVSPLVLLIVRGGNILFLFRRVRGSYVSIITCRQRPRREDSSEKFYFSLVYITSLGEP